MSCVLVWRLMRAGLQEKNSEAQQIWSWFGHRAAGLWQRSVLSGTGDQRGGACVAGSVLLGSNRPLLEMVLKIMGSGLLREGPFKQFV